MNYVKQGFQYYRAKLSYSNAKGSDLQFTYLYICAYIQLHMYVYEEQRV